MIERIGWNWNLGGLAFSWGSSLERPYRSHVRYVQSLRPSSAPIRFLNFAVALYIISPDSQPCHDFSISRIEKVRFTKGKKISLQLRNEEEKRFEVKKREGEGCEGDFVLGLVQMVNHHISLNGMLLLPGLCSIDALDSRDSIKIEKENTLQSASPVDVGSQSRVQGSSCVDKDENQYRSANRRSIGVGAGGDSPCTQLAHDFKSKIDVRQELRLWRKKIMMIGFLEIEIIEERRLQLPTRFEVEEKPNSSFYVEDL
ncbi:hypothetical protein Sjap_015439 [Stephania japonica]|uniref:Uncharacterized protein n=1 Tax=Stephania japonica TaxID=461633 RepID=A0AAP0IL14_9MAGN